MLKLDVYVTARDGSDEALFTKYGITSPKIHIISKSASRSKVFRGTNDQAYKLVLNTQSGQYAEFSHLVANHGTYIEVGLGVTRSDDKFYVRPNKNVIFASIDLTDAYNESREDLGK